MPVSRRRKLCVCPVDLDRVNQAALSQSHEVIPSLLPGGVTGGTQYVVPSKDERRLLSIFLDSGKWSDFKVVAHGGDLVGLIAHVFNLSERDAARLIAHLLDIEWRAAPNVGDTTEGAQ
jgi:putative DNA primase/helicase